MPDTRRHRGPHPGDRMRFSEAALPSLRAAVRDLCWLLDRDYPPRATLSLVGDRHRLDARQRVAVRRAACSTNARERRLEHRIEPSDLHGHRIWIDGFNLLTTIEAALADGVILRCRDHCPRDMASMHGSWKRVEETLPAITALTQTLDAIRPAEVLWLFDRPVSNSGRVAAMIESIAGTRHWRTVLCDDPDGELIHAQSVVAATADSAILDRCRTWSDLVTPTIAHYAPGAWILDLATPR